MPPNSGALHRRGNTSSFWTHAEKSGMLLNKKYQVQRSVCQRCLRRAEPVMGPEACVFLLEPRWFQALRLQRLPRVLTG